MVSDARTPRFLIGRARRNGARVSTRLKVVAVAVFAAAILFCTTSVAFAVPAPRRVVIVLAPYLTWGDVISGPMPSTRQIAASGLVADMNDRSGQGPSTGATPSRGALMLSAGASMIEDPTALSTFDASESVGAEPASDVYRQVFGHVRGKAGVLYLGQPQQALANTVLNPGPALGGLGDAAHRVGAVTVAIGCSDPGVGVGVALRPRPAGIVAASSHGRVDFGDVSESLLTTDVTSPYGVRTDVPRLGAAFERALSESAGSGTPHFALIVIDPGDLARSYAAGSMSTTPAAAVQHTRAVGELDRVIGLVRKGLAPGDTLIIVSQVVPSAPNIADGFAPLIVSGPLGRGLATSASTHRDGIVTLADVSASAIAALGGQVPPSMVGGPIERAGAMASSTLSQRVERLQLMANTAVAVETVRVSLVDTYVVLAVLVFLACALILSRGVEGLPGWTNSLSRVLLLLVACIPLAAIIEFAIAPYPAGPTQVVLLLAAVSALLLAALWYATRTRAVTLPLIAVTGLTALLIMIDQWLGAPLSWVSIFGYSPLEGSRYYGIGNEMGGLLLGSALVVAGLVLDTWRDARWAPVLRRWGWPALGAVVLLSAGAPTLGANVAAPAWAIVGFGVGWLLLSGHRVWTWRNAAIVVVLVAVIFAVFGLVDVLRGSGAQTHLGRLITDIAQSGLGSLWIILARKAVTNARVLGKTYWTWLALAVVGLLGYMRWRPRGEFATMLRAYPAFSAAVAGALFAGVTGYLTADSGIVVPALMLVPVGVAAHYLMIARLPVANAD